VRLRFISLAGIDVNRGMGGGRKRGKWRFAKSDGVS